MPSKRKKKWDKKSEKRGEEKKRKVKVKTALSLSAHARTSQADVFCIWIRRPPSVRPVNHRTLHGCLEIQNFVFSCWKIFQSFAVLTHEIFSHTQREILYLCTAIHVHLYNILYFNCDALISLFRLKKIYQVLHNRLLEKFWNQVTYHLNLWKV